jgi:hypothetical protein
MATETATGLSDHMRGVTVTTLTCLAGIAAGLVCGVVLGTSAQAADNALSLAVVGAFLLAQFPVLKAIGVDVEGFGAKDYLYVSFMTFTLWFITYAILLSAEVQL